MNVEEAENEEAVQDVEEDVHSHACARAHWRGCFVFIYEWLWRGCFVFQGNTARSFQRGPRSERRIGLNSILPTFS